ncbi:MmcQ/YjbR family DNA-binding protein [Kitasatospora paracochleata]|uniref:DNA-binding protein (MmcQ/YjbR family) n=1 Tax=Kitasatospora paracochleata TaxID=58354 RepID=A0ABT1IZF1_9ACTN|nr:MmcQ/YjbR family DNA-binding protein [Kitasatospora paracochleata]MCP2310530.1 hypothetical protein [Kitasatospora paracochleata]
MVTFDRFKAMALALPQTHEEITWDEVTLRLGKKIFAMGNPGAPAVCVKASREEQAELLATAPDVYSVAPYVGRHGWVLVDLAGVDERELHDLVTDAWRSVAPKRLLREVDTD